MTVLYDFDGKGTVFPFLQEFQASVTILRTLMPKHAIWTKRAPHDLKRAFFTIFMKSALFSIFERIWGHFHDFENFDAPKCDLAKTCSAWPEKSVLYNFLRKRNVFPFWREFKASFTILRTLTLKNAIWPKRAAHDLKKRVLYNFYEKLTVFPFLQEFQASVTILRTLSLKTAIWPKRAAHDLKERFIQFSWKARCFSVLKRIWA